MKPANASLTILPVEIKKLVLNELDMKSLSQLAQVNKDFNKLVKSNTITFQLKDHKYKCSYQQLLPIMHMLHKVEGLVEIKERTPSEVKDDALFLEMPAMMRSLQKGLTVTGGLMVLYSIVQTFDLMHLPPEYCVLLGLLGLVIPPSLQAKESFFRMRHNDKAVEKYHTIRELTADLDKNYSIYKLV